MYINIWVVNEIRDWHRREIHVTVGECERRVGVSPASAATAAATAAAAATAPATAAASAAPATAADADADAAAATAAAAVCGVDMSPGWLSSDRVNMIIGVWSAGLSFLPFISEGNVYIILDWIESNWNRIQMSSEPINLKQSSVWLLRVAILIYSWYLIKSDAWVQLLFS